MYVAPIAAALLLAVAVSFLIAMNGQADTVSDIERFTGQAVEAGLESSATATADRLVRIARLETPGTNNEFTRNVEIMQARVRKVANLNQLLAAETEPAAREKIEIQIAELMQRINDDNKRMAESYGYSLTRRYVRNIEKATVLLVLSDKEVERIRVDAEAKGNEPPKSVDSNLLSICTLNTSQAAQVFQRDVSAVQAQRNAAVQLHAAVEAAKTPEDRAYARGKLDQALGQINALNRAMVAAYGFSITRNYVLQIDMSSLYVWSSDGELAGVSQTDKSNP